jgi:hypothetical protein
MLQLLGGTPDDTNGAGPANAIPAVVIVIRSAAASLIRIVDCVVTIVTRESKKGSGAGRSIGTVANATQNE